MSEETKTIYVYKKESALESIVADVYSFGTLIAVVWIGVWLDSTALQWIGGICWILWVLSRASIAAKKSRMTIPEARKFLDELEKA